MYFYSVLTELLNTALQINFQLNRYTIRQENEVGITRFQTISGRS